MLKAKKLLPLVIILLCSFLAWFFNLPQYFDLNKLKEHKDVLENFVSDNKLNSIIIFSIIYIIVVALSIPGASFLTLTGGLLFGQIIATSTVVISATIGASIIFLTVKMASGDFFEKKAGTWVKKLQKGFQENAFFYLLSLRLVPVFPFVIINLVSAILQVPLRIFFWGTFIGIIPGSFVYVSIGVALREVIDSEDFTVNLILDGKILTALIGLGILSLLPILIKKYKEKTSKNKL